MLTPVVLWHGMGDSCCNPLSMGYITKLIQNQLPGIYVHSLKLGNNVVEDMEHGFFGNMNDLVDEACQKIQADVNLKNGFNALGFSQGGLFLRVLAQSCPEAKILNLISFGGPQQGIFGFPYCKGSKGICNAVRHLLNYGAYSRIVQNFSVQAQFWHDPIVSEGYAKKNIFLADFNCANEEICNPQYKTNLVKLKNFVLIQFLQDEMVVPKESEWFGYFLDNNASVVVPYTKTKLYQNDLIGLKIINDTGRLHLISVDGKHLQVPKKTLYEIFDKFLKNTGL